MTTTLKIEGLGTYEIVTNDAGEITKVVWVQYAAHGEVRLTVGRGTKRHAKVIAAMAA